jgi:RNA polymerase primary sigma factor
MTADLARCLIRRMLYYVDGREQMIIVRRFELADDKQTLLEVGRELGIRKERVRQLESRAINKLRTLVELQKLDSKDESNSGGDDGDDR